MPKRRTAEEKDTIRKAVSEQIAISRRDGKAYSDDTMSSLLYSEHGIMISAAMLRFFRCKEGLKVRASRSEEVQKAIRAAKEAALDGDLLLERAIGRAEARIDSAALMITEAHDAIQALKTELEERRKRS